MNYTVQQKPKAKITIVQKTEILKTQLEATNVIYQPDIGYLIITKKQNVSVKQLNIIANNLNLKVSLFGLGKDGYLRILLELNL